MAYNEEALKAKLSTLAESQDSIVGTSQWITFHRRHATSISTTILSMLKTASPQKRLNYLYLINDIVQHAKSRKRPEFPDALSPIIAEAVQQAYRGASTDLRNKIQRLIDVWKQRAVFEESILSAIQARIDEVDKAKGGSGGKKLMGQSLFGSQASGSVPKELEALAKIQTSVSKADFTTRPLVDSAQAEHKKLNDPTTPKPSAPVYAAGLSSLIKKLVAAEAGLAETISTRQNLIIEIQKLLDNNKLTLEEDQALHKEMIANRAMEEANKRQVEDDILRGFNTDTDMQNDGQINAENGTRPDIEALTPEPEEVSFQPTSNPALSGLLAGFADGDDMPAADTASMTHMAPAQLPFQSPADSERDTEMEGPHSSKKRKLEHGYSYSTTADQAQLLQGSMDDENGYNPLEADLDDLIRSQSRGGLV